MILKKSKCSVAIQIVWSVSVSKDGLIATGSADASAGLWVMPTFGESNAQKTMHGGSFRFSADGKWLVRNVSGERKFWDRHRQSDVMSLPPAPPGVTNPASWRESGFIPGTDPFISVAAGSGLHVWRVGESEINYVQSASDRTNLQGPLRFCRQRRWMALRDGLDQIVVWDTSSWREVAVFPLDSPLLGSFEFAQEGKQLVALYTDGRLRFWKTGSWSPERMMKVYSRPSQMVDGLAQRALTPLFTSWISTRDRPAYFGTILAG